MKILLLILGLAVLCLAVAVIAESIRIARLVSGMTDRLLRTAPPIDVAARLPDPVRSFALRADANPADLARGVRFEQAVEMLLKPGRSWQPLVATQIVATGAAGFLWQARQKLGPLPKFQVVDAYEDGRGLLQARLLGLLPVVKATGPDIDRGEALRYLAELPWAPDAILGNPDICWRMREDGWAEATLDTAAGPAAVRFCFDDAGDIAEVVADARSAPDDAGNPVEYPWNGFFRDYRMIGPRRIPAEAEVGYLCPDGYRPYFQCRITGYDAVH